MDYYVGIDVSVKDSSVCVVDGKGKTVKEAKVASEPEALAEFFAGLGLPLTLVGLEAGPLSQWLHAGLEEAGIEVVLMETRKVQAALSAMPVKTDRNDARGIAQLLRTGFFTEVYRKSDESQEARALLTARKLLVNSLIDVEQSIRGILRGFGLKVGPTTKPTFEARIHDLAEGRDALAGAIDPLLIARRAIREQLAVLDKRARVLARQDEICQRLMTAPGVGALTALTFKTGVDDPARFGHSRAVGAHFGLTPRRYQSGETDIVGSITKCGDAAVRSALYEAALSILTKVQKHSVLQAWGLHVAKRRGMKRAIVAVARKLGTILHRMWTDGTDFFWSRAEMSELAATA
jgi:transposase